MASTIELAKKGSVKDMTALYHGVKAEVYGLCRLLLDNEKTASSAVAPIFQNLWDSLLTGEIASQEAFEKKATAKTIAYCVTKTKKKNPKAFQPPKDGGDGLALGKKLCLEGQPWELVLGNLTDLARFLFVLHGVCGYDAKRLAALLEWKPEAVQKILDGEEQTVASICDAVSTHKKIPFAMTAEELHQQLKAQTQQDALPETAQRAVLGRIDSLCFSIRKKSKRNKILAGVIAGIVVVACAVAFCETVKAAGYIPMFYASPSKAYTLDMGYLSDYPFWLAHDTRDQAPSSYRYTFDMWQYSSSWRVPGIDGDVDVNICLTPNWSVWQ